MQTTIRGTLAATLLLSASALSAQQPRFQPPPQQPPPQQQPPQQQPPSQQAPRQPAPPQPELVAKVNGDAITKAELEAEVQNRVRGQQVPPDAAGNLHEQTLESLIEGRLIEQYVVDEGPDVGPQEVEAVVGRFKQQLAAQRVGYGDFLASRGYTEEAFEKRIEGSLAWQKYQQQQLQPDKLRQFFEQNRDQFQADSFEEAQQDVVRVYRVSLWDGIVRQAKPNAEIEILRGDPQPDRQPPTQPPTPQGLPR